MCLDGDPDGCSTVELRLPDGRGGNGGGERSRGGNMGALALV